MLDPDLIRMLSDPNITRRRQAIKLLAKSDSADALEHLKDAAISDDDPEVRELARKAAAYLQKRLGTQPPAAIQAYDDTFFVGYDIETSLLVPSDFEVSPAEERYAKDMLETAIDYNVRGDHHTAVARLKTAFKANPRLMYDDYARYAALDIAGGSDLDAAVAQFSPGRDALRKRLRKRPRVRPIQRLLALGVILAGLVVLLGTLLYPWADLSAVPMRDVPLVDITEDATIGSTYDSMKALINSPEAGVGLLVAIGPVRAQSLRDAVNTISLQYTWHDAVLVFTGQSDIARITGVQGVADQLDGVDFNILGIRVDGTEIKRQVDASVPPIHVDPWDYTIYLVPPLAVLTLITGLLLLIKPSLMGWLVCLVAGLVNLLSVLHFYDDIQTLVPQGFSVSIIGQILNLPPVIELVGYGFWMTFVGVLVVTLIPFLGAFTRGETQ